MLLQIDSPRRAAKSLNSWLSADLVEFRLDLEIAAGGAVDTESPFQGKIEGCNDTWIYTTSK